MSGLPISRRTTLATGAAALTMPFAPAHAKINYDLNPMQVADGVWLIEGALDSFTRVNGGAMVNIVLVETPAGAVVIDTGTTAKMGSDIRAFADQRLGGVAMAINTNHHPDHWFGNVVFTDVGVAALRRCGVAALRRCGVAALRRCPKRSQPAPPMHKAVPMRSMPFWGLGCQEL
ncbi:MAG: MBL fold metallo-hydrolase [Pseudomonadota bacterium]